MLLIEKVLFNGECGAGLGALQAAKACSVATGGTTMLGFATEIGRRSRLLQTFGLRETETINLEHINRCNIRDSDMVFVMAVQEDEQNQSIFDNCQRYDRPLFIINPLGEQQRENYEQYLDIVSDKMTEWLKQNKRNRKQIVLSVLGSKETQSPGIEENSERLITHFLHRVNVS